MAKRKVMFVINPHAGKGKTGKSINQIIDLIGAHSKDFSHEVLVTTDAEEATKHAKDGANNNFDTIVAVGGDGTIHEVCQGIIDTKASLGVIPCGSGNDFIKNFDFVKNNIKKSIDLISQNKKKLIDVGIVNNEKCFINSAGLGFDAKIALDKQRSSSKNYFLDVVKNLFSYKPIKTKIITEDFSIHGKILLCEIGNGKFAGGQFALTPNAIMDDGYLDVCLMFSLKFFDRFKLLSKVMSKKHIYDDKVTMLKVKQIDFESDKIDFIHCDGEIYNIKNGRVSISIKEKNISIIIP